MIDFRYHLVSLISVFLALAVGIVLGAGPLKESIGDTLTGEVDALRQRAADLRTELDERSAELADSEAAFAAAADGLLGGLLEERRVAVVSFGDRDGGATDDVVQRLEQAGATVSARVRLTDDWVDTSRATFRRTIAGTLVEYLDPVPPAGAGAATELAESLVQALATGVPDDPDALGENAAIVLQLMADGGLIEIDGEVTAPADAVVVVAGGFDEPLGDEGDGGPDEDARAELEDEVGRWAGVIRELSAAALLRTEGFVFAGHEAVPDGLVVQVREGQRTATTTSTVADVQELVGQVSVPLALAERISGVVGHYGFGNGATAPVPPRVELPPVQRVPELPPADPEQTTEDQAADPGDGSGETTDQG